MFTIGSSIIGGDGGTRTRVRKLSISNVYERSRLFFLTGHLSVDRVKIQSAAEARKLLFHPFSSVLSGTLTFYRLHPLPVRGRKGQT